jgi:shikimate kinase
VLIGPPGGGKTVVGRALAARLGVDFRDTDADVEALGTPITDIFRNDGEAAFRALERAAVATALTSHKGVLALGGGAVTDALTRERLHAYTATGGTIVFLDVSRDAVAERLGSGASRPLIAGGDPLDRWQNLADQRRPLYEDIANVYMDTSQHSPDVLAEIIDEEIAE